MMKLLVDWFDDRTGFRKIMHEGLYENIPGGSRWRYVSGSMLVFAFVTQMVTGLFLWMCYSPGSQNAWESVYYIQYEMQGGWLLRGIHHFMAQAMVVLLPLHMLQVIVDKAYKAPREINYWLGLILMLIVLGLGLTGYLLPWDQKGYWATKVATNLMSLTPMVGGQVQKLVVGGSDYGHATLTRFFALHAGLLPILMIGFLALHVAMFRKHGITTHPTKDRPDEFFWPQQVFKDAVACLLLLVIVLLAVVHFDVVGVLTGSLPLEHRGAELGAPADPVQEYSAARPEWYFLFLFQLLKKFKDEFIGAIVLPGALFTYLVAMPLVARAKIGHALNVAVMAILMIGAGYLTIEAMVEDSKNASYKQAVAEGHEEAQRVRELVEVNGIPREGALALVHKDPEIQGPRIFKRNCASCHNYLDAAGDGIAASEVSAPNLYGFANRAWFRRILDPDKDTGISGDDMFGKTMHKGGEMVKFVHAELKDEKLKDALEALAIALSAEAKLVSQREEDAAARKDGTIAKGLKVFAQTFSENSCDGCHKLNDQGDLGSAPDLSGYGSYEWLKAFISNPADDRFYGEEGNDRMPAFHSASKKLLSEHEIDMLVRWIRGDDKDLRANIGVESPPKKEEAKKASDNDDNDDDESKKDGKDKKGGAAKKEAANNEDEKKKGAKKK